ncbi:hypothetical protein PT2222_320070 [Paraburkholderia tropica]
MCLPHEFSGFPICACQIFLTCRDANSVCRKACLARSHNPDGNHNDPGALIYRSAKGLPAFHDAQLAIGNLYPSGNQLRAVSPLRCMRMAPAMVRCRT